VPVFQIKIKYEVNMKKAYPGNFKNMKTGLQGKVYNKDLYPIISRTKIIIFNDSLI
jgi:hypothetical protein